MSDAQIHNALSAFAASVRQDRRAGQTSAREAALELRLAPRFQSLIEALLAICMPEAPRVLREWDNPGIGRPDLVFKREGTPARSFIELKQPETNLDPRRLRGHDQDQFRRFKKNPYGASATSTPFTSTRTANCRNRRSFCLQPPLTPRPSTRPLTD